MSVIAMQSMTDRLAMMIESIVDYMGVSTGSGEKSLVRYDRALPFMSEVLDEMRPETPEQRANNAELEARGESSGDLILDLCGKFEPPKHLDFAWLSTSGDGNARSRTKWAANRVRRVNPKHCRGATIIAPYMVEQWVAIVNRDATYQEARYFVARLNGRWRYASQHHPIRSIERQFERGAAVGTWLHGEVAESWQVLLGYEGAPRIRFGTTAEGVLDCFRLRDLPNGRSRRSALIHWVERHWRQKAGGLDDERTLVEVRRHLRGARSFTWNGLSCEVIPLNDAKG